MNIKHIFDKYIKAEEITLVEYKFFLDKVLDYTKGQDFTSVIDLYSFLVDNNLIEDTLKEHRSTKKMYFDISLPKQMILHFHSLGLIEYTDEDFMDFKKK